MTLKNSTTWPNWFLRRMISWCCQELELPVSKVKGTVFRNSRSSWSGCARYWRGITVCVGSADCFPRKNRGGATINDRDEALVWVTAHELAHLLQHQANSHTRLRGGWGGAESATDWHALPILAKFQAARNTLLAQWLTPPVARLRGPELTLTERRARKAVADLSRWQRRLKLAQTKVRKLRTRVNYYQKKTNL